MELVKKVDRKLEELFKGAPKMSENSKESLAKIWPWLALIGGILQLWSAWVLWGLTRVVDYVDSVYRAYGIDSSYTGMSSTEKAIIYLGVIVLLVEAVMLLVAFPKLKNRQKSGWNLLFGVLMLNAVYAIVSVFIDGRGPFNLIVNAIFIAIGLWLLFQVKEKFGGNVVIPSSKVVAVTDKPVAVKKDDEK